MNDSNIKTRARVFVNVQTIEHKNTQLKEQKYKNTQLKEQKYPHSENQSEISLTKTGSRGNKTRTQHQDMKCSTVYIMFG